MDAASVARAARFPTLAKYELLEELGHGGMATVYRAVDKRLGREVAVKVIHAHLRDSGEAVSRFHTEARAVAKLKHPNIVEVFDVSDADDPEQYLVVELLRGTNLRKLLEERGALPPEVAAAVALDLLGALAHAHAHGVVHRDVKPENVLIERRGDGPASSGGGVAVKLTDFGIAKLLDARGVTSTGQVLGSPAHMSPEQIEGEEVDVRADVFALGVLAYEAMVGHLPFQGANPAQVLRNVLDGRYAEAQRERPTVGARWSAILDRALARARDARFADAASMRDAVSAELERVGATDPAGELAAWFDDADAYGRSHCTRMVERLVGLGGEARRRGDTIGAAADFNRALAYAPHDPQLLKLAAATHRATTRARRVRRAGAVLGGAVGVAGAAFAFSRLVAVHAHLPASPPSPTGATAVVLPDPIVAPALPPPDVAGHARSAGAAGVTVGESSARPGPPREGPAKEPSPRVVERTFTMDLTPKMGIKLSLDEQPARAVSNGWTLTLDTKPHTLTFSCDVCTPVTRIVAAGDRDEALTVNVPIRPATLAVEGDPRMTYQVVEDPQLVVRAGVNSIPLKSRFLRLTVRQLETKLDAHVELEAGKVSTVAF